MNNKQKQYILDNWKQYDLVDSKEDMLALLNILEANEENLDSLHAAEYTREFCGIWSSENLGNGSEIVEAMFSYYQFFSSYKEMMALFNECAIEDDMSLDEYIQYEDIIKTSDGYIRKLHY